MTNQTFPAPVILQAERVGAHVVQIVQDDTFGIPLFWVQVRNAQTSIVELHERSTEQAARTMANQIWLRLRKAL